VLLEMFVNELSLTPAALDVPTGQNRARQFVLTMREATARGVQRTLRLPEYFFANPIGPNYYWGNWLNDNRVELEIRQFFRLLATRVPFLGDEPDIEAVWRDIDCFWQNQSALGLKAAYLADGLALSMSSGQEWDSHSIECDIHELAGGDLECRREVVHHAASPGHIVAQVTWIRGRIQGTVRDGRELWRRFGDFFPSLTCCPVVEEQMAGLPSQALPSIVRGLFNLNAFCVTWQNGGFNPDEIQCAVSPESEPTLQRYSGERRFMCPDAQERVFKWHAKVGSWRIYFDPAPGPGRLFVGYVGKHLRTATSH
jgi:hypothetical protein